MFIPGERPYLGGSKTVPSYPHLIVCPGTLIAQWVSELKVCLRPKSVDIFVYDGHSHSEHFWGESGLLHLSKQKPHNKIIVASHSVSFCL